MPRKSFKQVKRKFKDLPRRQQIAILLKMKREGVKHKLSKQTYYHGTPFVYKKFSKKHLGSGEGYGEDMIGFSFTKDPSWAEHYSYGAGPESKHNIRPVRIKGRILSMQEKEVVDILTSYWKKGKYSTSRKKIMEIIKKTDVYPSNIKEQEKLEKIDPYHPMDPFNLAHREVIGKKLKKKSITGLTFKSVGVPELKVYEPEDIISVYDLPKHRKKTKKILRKKFRQLMENR